MKKLLIITHVVHGKDENYFGYAPYVREMNIWTKYASEVVIVAPLQESTKTVIDLEYQHNNIDFKEIREINFQSFLIAIISSFKIPSIFWKIVNEMRSADYIHLRCPGNIGLIGCIAQLFFPSKEKSAKYAGNWDPNSKQPISYKIQKWILSNTFLTRNMQVLVYGDWSNQSKNIKSFFTASYFEKDKIEIAEKKLEGLIKFLFVGTLSSGKRPLYAVKLVHQLIKKGNNVSLSIYGEGAECHLLEEYIQEHLLQRNIILYGNREEKILRAAYQEAHFIILASQSEGWPKVVAEAMFWGAVPIASAISCVPFMLDYGKHGLLLRLKLENDVEQITKLLNNDDIYNTMSTRGKNWSRFYTIDKFENKIKLLLS